MKNNVTLPIRNFVSTLLLHCNSFPHFTISDRHSDYSMLLWFSEEVTKMWRRIERCKDWKKLKDHPVKLIIFMTKISLFYCSSFSSSAPLHLLLLDDFSWSRRYCIMIISCYYNIFFFLFCPHRDFAQLDDVILIVSWHEVVVQWRAQNGPR